VDIDALEPEVLAAVKTLPGLQKYLENATIVKEIVVPGKLVNLVVR
jgi:leucyl-tRNA synthetase